ncbi:Arm DNA-binding domain-containing protein [Cronobacter dublinensis]
MGKIVLPIKFLPHGFCPILTIKQIDAAKLKEKPYHLAAGIRLYLYMPASGKKVWQVRYRIDGKEKTHTVGKYPEIGPADVIRRICD